MGEDHSGNDTLQDIDDEERLRRYRADLDDLQDELAGRVTGRISRFIPDAARFDNRTSEKKNAGEMAMHMALSQLDLLMADPEYAALYRQVSGKVDSTADRIAETEEQLDREQADAEQALAETRARAARLDDGRRVYRRADGFWMTEEGTALSEEDALAAGLTVPDNAPSWEEYSGLIAWLEQISEYWAQVAAHKARAGHIRARLDDHENPPDKEELREADEELDEISASLAEINQAVVEAGQVNVPVNASDRANHTGPERMGTYASAADEYAPEGRIDAPDMSGSFAAASVPPLDIPDLDVPPRPSVDAPAP